MIYGIVLDSGVLGSLGTRHFAEPAGDAPGPSVSAKPLPIGPKVVRFCGSYLGSYKVIPKRNYFGSYG